MVFHTLHRGQRDTRLCTLISYRSLRCTINFSPPQESFFTSLSHSFRPRPLPPLSLPLPTPLPYQITYSHHCIPTYTPLALFDPSHRYNSDHVSMYCETVFCCFLIYSSMDKNLVSSLAVDAEVYLHLPSGVLSGSCHASRLATRV